MKQRLLLFIATLILAGCETDKPQATIDLAPLSTQIGNLSDANADLRAANERLLAANGALKVENERLKAILRADADAGLAANAKGWLPFEGYVWRHQLALLPGIQPDALTAAKWTEASGLYAAGGEAAMQNVIDSLHSDATAQATKLGELSQNIEQLTMERDSAQKAADEALKRAQEAKDALVLAVAKATADERARLEAETRAWQARSANWFGGLLGIAALGCFAGMIFLSEAAKLFRKAGIVAGAGCATLIVLARFLSSPWFDVAWKATLAVGASGGIIWGLWELRAAIKRVQAGKDAERMAAIEKAAAEDAAKKAAEVRMVADTIITRLDSYYDNEASPEAKADMDAKLWSSLQAEGPAYDAAVKRIKAAQCDAEVAK